MIRCVEVSLVIPDNEARTALDTLRRLGVELGRLERADLYRCEVAAGDADRLVAALCELEPIFNPNKHALRVRGDASPARGEVWIDDRSPSHVATAPLGGAATVAGRRLPGVSRIERFTAWRLFELSGVPAAPAVVAAATDTLLCNPAYQKALT